VEMSGQIYTPANLTQGKKSPVSTEYETGWGPRAGPDVLTEEKSLLLLPEIKSQTIHLIA